MLNVEKFILLSLNHDISGAESLFRAGRVACTLADLESARVIRFEPRNLQLPEDVADPLIKVIPGITPSHPGLNKVFDKISKVHNKSVSSALGKGFLDPEDEILKQLALSGVLTEEDHRYVPISEKTVSDIADECGLVLRRQKTPSPETTLVLNIIEIINGTAMLLGSEMPDASPAELSKAVNEHPIHHPVVTALESITNGAMGLMKKSVLAAR